MDLRSGPSGETSRDDDDPIRLSDAALSGLREIASEALAHSPTDSDLRGPLTALVSKIAVNNLTRELLTEVEDLDSEIAEVLLQGALEHVTSIERALPNLPLHPAIRSEFRDEIESIKFCLQSAFEFDDQLTAYAAGELEDPAEGERFLADALERCREFFAGAGGKFDSSLIDPPGMEALLWEDEDDADFTIESIAEWKRSREALEDADEDDDERRSSWNPDDSKLEQLISDLRSGNLDPSDLDFIEQNAQEVAVALVMYAEDIAEQLEGWTRENDVGEEVSLASAFNEVARHLRLYQDVVDGELGLT